MTSTLSLVSDLRGLESLFPSVFHQLSIAWVSEHLVEEEDVVETTPSIPVVSPEYDDFDSDVLQMGQSHSRQG